MTASFPILNEIGYFYPQAQARFVRRKTWLANTAAVRRLPWGGFAPAGMPAFSRRRLLQLWLATWRNEQYALPTSADCLQINLGGTRLRAFDLRRDRSYKVVAVDSRYGGSTENEVRVRRDVLPGSGIAFPRVHTLGRHGGYLMMEEELVHGRRWNVRRDGDRFEQDIAAPLSRLIQHFGLDRRPLSSLLPADSRAVLADTDHGLPLVAHLRALIERNPQVAVSLCHGDLSASNVAVGPGGAVFLDWEKAREHFVGYDLLMMARGYAGQRHIQGCARRFFTRFQGGALDFADGLALQMLEDRVSHVQAWDDLSEVWQRVAGAG